MSKYLTRTALAYLILLITLSRSHAQTPGPSTGRIFFSNNHGDSWQRADEGFPQTSTVNDFAYAGGILFAGTEADGVFLSKDSSRSWQQSSHGLPVGVKIDAMRALGSRVIIGTNKHGILISEDSGEKWYASNDGLINLTVRCLYLFGSRIFAGTNNGVFVSVDSGKSWKHALAGKQINGITSLKDKIYVGLNRGALISGNEGETWESIFDRSAIHNISTAGNYVFAMSYEPIVLRTQDEGMNWKRADMGLPHLYTFQITSIGNRLLACQWDGIYKSDNDGESWIKSSDGLPLDAPLKELIVTDFGIIAGAGLIKR